MHDSIFWGNVELPASVGDQHFCIIGAPGSGKTKSILLLLKSILPGIHPGSNRRAVIYDAKRDIYATLVGMGVPEGRISILNPFDARCSAWDMSKDINSAASASEIGTLLVPDRNEREPFFPEAARSIIGGLMEAYVELAPGRWTLRDVVLALRSEDRMRTILEKVSHTSHIAANYLTGTDTQKSVTATIANTMRRLAFVAAAWDRATSTFSLHDFLRSERVLLLGSNPALNSTVQQINAAIVHRLTQLVIDGSEANRATPPPQTWIVIDELRMAGRFDVLPGFMVAGRSKGACVVIGFQDLPGLVEVYGQHLAEEIIGACRNKAFLKITEDRTAQYASDHFGIIESELTQYTRNWGESTSEKWLSPRETTYSQGVSEQKTRSSKPALLPSDFQQIPEPNRRNGIGGYFHTACLEGIYYATVPGHVVDRELPPPPRNVEDVVPRPTSHEVLRDWNPKDLLRLGLAGVQTLLDSTAKTKVATNALPEREKPLPAQTKPKPLWFLPKGNK